VVRCGSPRERTLALPHLPLLFPFPLSHLALGAGLGVGEDPGRRGPLLPLLAGPLAHLVARGGLVRVALAREAEDVPLAAPDLVVGAVAVRCRDRPRAAGRGAPGDARVVERVPSDLVLAHALPLLGGHVRAPQTRPDELRAPVAHAPRELRLERVLEGRAEVPLPRPPREPVAAGEGVEGGDGEHLELHGAEGDGDGGGGGGGGGGGRGRGGGGQGELRGARRRVRAVGEADREAHLGRRRRKVGERDGGEM
jgi:hypothetical protein